MSDSDSLIIYVRLVERPENLEAVRAVKLGPDRFRLLESSPDPEHHYWGYSEGDEVVCVEVEFAPGERGYVVEAKSSLP